MPIKAITKGIRAERSFFRRYGSLIVVPLTALLPLVCFGMYKAAQSNNNNIRQWLPKDLPAAEEYDRFQAHFRTDEFAIVSWEGCTFDDARLDQFVKRVTSYTTARVRSHKPGVVDAMIWWVERIVSGGQPIKEPLEGRLFESVLTGPRVFDELLAISARRFDRKLTRDDLIERFRGLFVGPDGKTTCALLQLTEVGHEDRVSAYKAILLAAREAGVPDNALRVGGDVVVNAVIDIESHAAIDQLTGYALLAGIFMALIALRSLRLALIVLIVAGYSAALSYAMVYFAGGEMNLILVVMPVLVYVLAIEGGLHLVNYYRAAERAGGLRAAPVNALRAGWLPCTLAAATTAVGLLSLNISHLEPVRAFGRYGALGVMITLLFLFLLLPLLLERYPAAVTWQAAEGAAPDAPSRHNRFVVWMARRIVRHRRAWLLFTIALVATLGAGLRQTSTSVSAVRFFPDDHDLVQDIHWLEGNIGPLVPVEIVVQFDNRKNRLSMVRRMELVRDLRSAVAGADSVGSVVAASSLAPPLPRWGGTESGDAAMLDGFQVVRGGDSLRRVLLDAGLRSNRGQFVQWGYLSQMGADERDETELWRITARFSAVSEKPYDHFVTDVRQRVETALASSGAEASAGVSAFYTGTVPLIHVAQRELLAGLFQSFLMAFALIVLTMMVLLRSVGAGLISMIPNVCPAILVFGGMGWIGKEIDVGAMLTASVAMGIAVDGTLHYVTWYRAAVAEGLTRPAAITQAYERCVGALVQSTAITGLALLVYATSTFEPVSQFGALMGLMLAAALLGNAVLLPAMMSTRIGRLFAARPKEVSPEAT